MAGFHDIIGHDMVKDHLQKAMRIPQGFTCLHSVG